MSKVQLEIQVPQDWTAVTLRDYLKLKKDLEIYNES